MSEQSEQSEQSDDRPLRGLRVLTFGSFVAGNTAALILAELGMDVVKIESRVRPEALRNTYFLDHPDVREPSGVPTTALYGGLARSVRSAAVELGAPGGPETFRRLAGHADVVVENFRPGVLDRFGCGFTELQAVNPRLTMLSISGYGRTGPRSSYAAYASNICNHVGLTSAWGHTHGYHFDYIAAYHGALGVMAALRRTAETGRGVHLDLAQVEAGASVMMPILVDHLATDTPYERRDNAAPRSLLAAVVALRRRRPLARRRGRRSRRLRAPVHGPRTGRAGDRAVAHRARRDAWRHCGRGRPAGRRTRRPTSCSAAVSPRHPSRTPPTWLAIPSCGPAASSSRSTTATSAASSTRAPSSAPCGRRAA